MATKRSNKTPIDKYMDKMEELAERMIPKPVDYSALYAPPAPIKFSIQATNRSQQLALDIMHVLDGYNINEIVEASNIVEQHVRAQSNGQFTNVPVRGY